MNSTLFSGDYPIGCNIKERLISDCVSERKTPFIITFDRNRNARDFGAVGFSLADFIPFLSADECYNCFTEMVGSNIEIRNIIERFILYFKSYTDAIGIGLLDVNRWSMRGLLQNNCAGNNELHSFLSDNFNSLATLENYIHHVALKIGTPNVDIRNALRTNKAMLYKISPYSERREQSVLLKYILRCIENFVSPDSGVIFFESLPCKYSNTICDFMSSNRFETKTFVNDLFVFEEHTKSALLSSCEKAVFFKHNGDTATRGISAFIGKHDVNQTTFTRYPERRRGVFSGMFSHSPTSDISMAGGGSDNIGYSVSKVEKLKLSPVEINNIQQDEAIVVNCSDKSYSIVKCR